VLNANEQPVATGKLIEGANGGMATWGEVKKQAAEKLGILLTNEDVGSVPLLRTDPYGNFIPAANGMPQVITGVGQDGIPNTSDDIVIVGNIDAPISLATAIRTTQAFLADIAHVAVPNGVADGDIEIGLNNPGFTPGDYDDELLDAHFMAGDGRANENIGLTAVHHVFHAEHNRLVEHTKTTVLASNDLAFLNEWLEVDVAAIPTTPAAIAALVWDGERLFQAAKFGTEMQYQHLVFEEFARKIQPSINAFLVPDGFDTTLDPSIVAEFAHTVYRFGHSMLTESIDKFSPTFEDQSISLIQGFLNPTAFNGTDGSIQDEIAAGAIIRGMTRQVGNEIDEFVTSALRNNLLGLPLDLATINLARGRDTGVPTLNAARTQFYAATNQDIRLKPYESWVDFAGNLKNEASIINFIAAYGTHVLITQQTTLQDKRDAALTLITGQEFGSIEITDQAAFDADRLAFLNATGIYAGGTLGGLNNVDLWIGGLAEKTMPFGGMLGATFSFVFETQMERLQSGDRFYYLQRLDGLHLFGEMENNSFASMIMRNTDATHLPSDVFSTPGLILEVDRTQQYVDINGDGVLENNIDPTGGGLLTQIVVRDNPATPGLDSNYLRYSGEDHVVLGGTPNADIMIASIGDDTLFGDGGNDRLEGGFGNDIINGGDGDDIITDNGGDDNIKAGAGNDVVHSGPGLDLVLGGTGQDFIFLGTDEGSEVFGGEGNDFIYGNKNAERILGNEGDDWLETGTFDGAPGDNFDEIFAQDGVAGHDVFLGDGGFDEFIGEGGDDIMVGSPGRGKMVGMSGWDWATYKDNTFAVDADLSRPVVFDENPTPPANGTLDTYEAVEGLSGTRFSDLLTGSNITVEERLPFAQGGSEGFTGSALDAAGIARISGLQAVVGAGVTSYIAGDIILGGDGNDVIMGLAGDDIIDGDKWLDVNIAVYATTARTGTPIAIHKSMTTLAQQMFNGTINPGQLAILREIKTDTTPGDIDIAKFQANRSEYAFSATADGQVIVSHAVEDSLDGTDRLRNIERVQFLDGAPLNIFVGTPGNDLLNGTAADDLILGLDGADTLNGLAGNDILVGGPGNSTSGNYADNFNTQSLSNSTGATAWTSSWVESGDNNNNNSPSAGQIRIDNNNSNELQFRDDDNDTGTGTATIQRIVNLAGATAATLSYNYDENSFDNGEIVTVTFAADGVNFNQTIQVINGNSGSGSTNVALTGPFTANSAIRFVVSGTNNNNSDDIVSIDNLVVSFSATETLNGGLGDDTYSFSLGDGNDIINEPVNATSGGSLDRISILAPIDTVSGLGLLTGLNAADTNTATTTGDLVINYTMLDGMTPVTQTITVASHFTGTNAQTGVERINFNGASYAGYLLGALDYAVSRTDPNNRDAGGVNFATSTVSNFIVGENGVNDIITGGTVNDLIFGGTGDNQLNGGAGDDLLVGGSGTGDDDLLDGGLDADTMVGLAGNDSYIVDDLLDVVVEAAGAGTDTVQTLMAELSISLMANVENLVYTGADADAFIGTGNALANVISGGDLADTLSGLDGNDTLNGGADNDTLIGGLGNDNLNGGAGADTMRGGGGDDVYDVDDAGDIVDESTADSSGTDRVESDVSFTLGVGVENLDLNGTATIGTGNELNNVINGNDENNQLFGGAGLDTLNGGDGNDLIDGGSGNDTISAGDDNDIIIGGSGNDTIDVGTGFNRIIYNSENFGDDVINSFDNAGGTAASQDLIDLSGLGITTATFATRVTEGTIGGTGNTLLTIRNAANTANIGTIRINNSTNASIDATDFILATAGPALPGATTGNNTLNGTVGNDTINALAGNDTVNGNEGNDTIIGGPGTDTLNGNDGDDTFIWNANASAPTDGRDVINGGNEVAVGDLFEIRGNASAETYSIFTRDAWDALAGNNTNVLNAATEIVVTRGGTDAASIIAELREIEEIRVNGVDPLAPGGTVAGDTFAVNGDFSGTSLRPNTIAIVGTTASDTIDISSLVSSHRVVFETNGGGDMVFGSPRPQDVFVGDYTVADGSYEPPMELIGDGGANVLTGGGGNDLLRGKDGADTLIGGGGDDNMNGGAGRDTFVFGHDFGNDTIVRFEGKDHLDISQLGITAADFASNVTIADLGNDTRVSIGEDSILLQGATVTQAHFLLAEDDVVNNSTTPTDLLLP
jgi:Ca2+-binding RTX toxin-like protein